MLRILCFEVNFYMPNAVLSFYLKTLFALLFIVLIIFSNYYMKLFLNAMHSI